MINPSTLLLPLHHIPSLNLIKATHSLLITSNHASPHNLSLLLSLFSSLNPSPSLSSSSHYPLSLFTHIPSPSTFPYNSLIRALSKVNAPVNALRVFVEMRRLAVPPDLHTLPFVVSAAARLQCRRLVSALHGNVVKLGFGGQLFSVNALIAAYAGAGALPEARLVFDRSPARDLITYNSILAGYVNSGDVFVAEKLFDEMPERDSITYGTLMAGLARTARSEAALKLLASMASDGVVPDDVALVTGLSACAQAGAIRRGRAVHGHVIRRRRASASVFLATALVDMYAKCGRLNEAVAAFERAPEKNLFTWNSLILGLAMHGGGGLCVDLLGKMELEGVAPDGTTFLAVLTGCSHAGLVEEAKRVFAAMGPAHGVEPELKHYGAMADILARAGRIEEALVMVRSMPMAADKYVWGGVLGGCRIHGEVTAAETAAAGLVAVKSEDGGGYANLAELYANEKKWDEVAAVKIMREKKGKKKAGHSTIQADAG